MPTTQVTLTKHFQENGESNGKAWTRNDFKTADGTRYSTFDGDLASQAKGLLNKPINLEYEIKERGQYVNNTILSISPISGVAETTFQSNGSQPTTPQADRQEQINRSAGLARAIEFVSVSGESILEAYDNGSLFLLALTFAGFFETGDYGAAAPSSAGAVGGELA